MMIPTMAAILLAVPAGAQAIQCPAGQTYRYGTCYPDKALLDGSPAPAKRAAEQADAPAAAPASAAPAAETPRRLETTWSKNEAWLEVGGFLPTAKITLGGEDDIASAGLAFGGRYFRDLSPNAALGIGIEKLSPGSHDSDVLVPNGRTTTKFDSLTVMGLARYAAGDDLRFTVTGGFGLHSSKLKIDVAPAPGLVWLDTGTRESRNFTDSTKTAAAFMLAAGIDARLDETFSAGGELAYYYLGSADYEASPAAKNIGYSGVNGSFAGLALSVHGSARF